MTKQKVGLVMFWIGIVWTIAWETVFDAFTWHFNAADRSMAGTIKQRLVSVL